jgi:hypothetical protein
MTAPASMMEQQRGELRIDEPLSRHTVWGIGGPAKRFYRPADVADLACFLADLPASERIFLLGLGSNVLVRDGGIEGTVIATDAPDASAVGKRVWPVPRLRNSAPRRASVAASSSPASPVPSAERWP